MWAFAPDRFLFGTAAFVDNYLAFAYALVSGSVKLYHTHGAMTGVFSLSVGSVIVINDITLAILVEEESRVDTLYFRKHDRVRPFAKGILSFHEEISGAHVGGDHVVSLVSRIVCDIRRKNTAAHMLFTHILEL